MSGECNICGGEHAETACPELLKILEIAAELLAWHDCNQMAEAVDAAIEKIKMLEESQDDAESIMSCLAMQARFYQRDMPLTTPVIQHGNSKLTVAVLFLAEDRLVARMDAEKRAEWEKRAAEMRAEARKDMK